jgi:hypothetical protein
MNTILNIASGKIIPTGLPDPYFLVNVDTMYYYSHNVEDIEQEWLDWIQTINRVYYCKENIYEFMERSKIIFDEVYIYRFLEHVPMDKILYFIYLVSTLTSKNSLIDIIVPNYKTLARMILDEKIDNTFESNNITLTTELLNQPPDPHASVWTLDRAKYFWELEKRFVVFNYEEDFNFDGRDIYLRFQARRV